MRTVLRRLGIGLGILLLLLVAAAGSVWVAGGRKLARSFDVPVDPVAEAPAADSALLARGEHLATAIGKCALCHGSDFGGTVFVDDPAIGRAVASNLTGGRGGIGAAYTMADWERAVRHGVAPNGRGLLVMPSDDFAPMSDADLVALVAYLRSVPPVDRELPPTRIRLVGRALYVTDRLPLVPASRIDHARVEPAPAEGVTRDYGRYLANLGGCTGCHGPTLAGGPFGEPGAPPASNLTPTGIGHYTEADFVRALRQGVRPGGAPIAPQMPVEYTRRMTDDEIRALWLYVRSVPGREFGARD